MNILLFLLGWFVLKKPIVGDVCSFDKKNKVKRI
jgi:hypothetical protein